jgi:hypothetical protein
MNTAARPSAAYRDQAELTADALLGLSSPTLAIWSKKNGTVVPVTTAVCWSKWASLRSRRD